MEGVVSRRSRTFDLVKILKGVQFLQHKNIKQT